MPYFKLDLEDDSMAVVHVHKASYPYYTGATIADNTGWDLSVSWNRYHYGWGNKWVYIVLNSSHPDYNATKSWNEFKFNNTIYKIEIDNVTNISVCSKKFYHENKDLKGEPKKNKYVVRDSQKGKMYKSERFYFKKQTLFGEEVEIYFGLIFESNLYKEISSYFTQYINVDLQIDTNPRGKSVATGSGHKIVLPNWAKNEMVILHELSHTIIYRIFSRNEMREKKIQGHGKEFCFIFALLVKEFMNEYYDNLIDGFDSWEVKYLTEMIGMEI